MPRLLVKKKEEIISEYISRKNKLRIFIGSKKGNDIVIHDKNVSEQRCTIIFENNSYTLKDQNTIMGTQINFRSITEATLSFGDEICIGDYKILFLDDALNKQDIVIPQYYFIGIYGKFYGKKYFLKSNGDTFIGRENLSPRGIENDIVLSGDMTVSKGHAKISAVQGQYTITDVGSTGGVAINGEKLGQLNSSQLALGDEISIGRTIFRVVDYFTEDYSLPAKQHLFALKIFKFIKIILTLAILAFSCASIGIGYTSYSLLNSSPSKLNLALDLNWNKEIPLRADTSSYDISTTPVIGDFDNDGTNDVAMLSSAGFLYAWSGATGDKLWKPVEIYNSGIASLVCDDINNDEVLDIIAVSESSLIYIIDGQTGNIIRREVLGGVISTMTPLVCDLDSNGKKDIVVTSEDGTVHFLYSPGFDSDYSKYSEFIDGPLYASPVILSRKDFSPFVVIANYDSKVYFIDGKTRTKKTVNLLELTGKAHLVAGAPAIGDINGDGIDEVVVQSNVPQYVSVIDTSKFSVMWTYFIEPVPPANLRFNASPVIADFNGDGIGDVAVVSANGTVQILKGKTTYPSGEMLWKLSIPESKRLLSSPAVYDFDKEGIPELIFGTEDGRIIVAKSNPKRKELEVMADIKASNLAITSTPLLSDINGDKKIEILYTNVQESIQVINTNAKTIKNLNIWPMFLANPEHTSTFSLKNYKDKYKYMMLIGLVLLLAFVFFKVRSSIKKSKKRVKVVYL
ncbi:MAG: FHA domain-containing protein [Endomicrobiaceae bacterium]|nr:FHA domain-containing protein [Endomicrobiaceae bacterium]